MSHIRLMMVIIVRKELLIRATSRLKLEDLSDPIARNSLPTFSIAITAVAQKWWKARLIRGLLARLNTKTGTFTVLNVQPAALLDNNLELLTPITWNLLKKNYRKIVDMSHRLIAQVRQYIEAITWFLQQLQPIIPSATATQILTQGPWIRVHWLQPQ